MPRGFQDCISRTRDRTQATAVKAGSPNHWTTSKFPVLLLLSPNHWTTSEFPVLLLLSHHSVHLVPLHQAVPKPARVFPSQAFPPWAPKLSSDWRRWWWDSGPKSPRGSKNGQRHPQALWTGGTPGPSHRMIPFFFFHH